MLDQRKTITHEDIIKRKTELYRIFCTKVPPVDWMTDADEFPKLQDFVCDNLREMFGYATALSIIEAIDNISISQVDNGNEKIVEDTQGRIS